MPHTNYQTDSKKQPADTPMIQKHTPSIDKVLKNDYETIKKTFAAIESDADTFIKQVCKYDNASRQPKNKINPVLEGVASSIPYGRRIVNIENNAEDNNPAKAVGLGAIALINLKEDFRDSLSIVGRSKSEAPKDYYAKFKFFAGTPIEKWLEKTKWGQDFLDNFDKTLGETRFGVRLRSLFGVDKDIHQVYAKEVHFPFRKPEIVYREYVKNEGKFLGKLLSLTSYRITGLGVLVAALLEIPKIYDKIKNKNDYLQIPKSAVNVVSYTVCGALGSTFLSLATGHPAGSIIGLGLGTYIGNKLAKFICNDKN